MKIFGIFLFGVLFSFCCWGNPEITKVLQDIKTLKLSEGRPWKKLLHIEPNVIGLKSTQVTDPKFLLSNSAEYKNLDELEATLRAFVEPAKKYEKQIDHPLKKNAGLTVIDHSQHPICRFPARLKYLRSALSNATEYWNSLPEVNCTYLKIFLDALSPKSISFVFSSYYADNPGSAFGHTFFRINRQTSGSGPRQELLDYGVGYAANVTVTNSAAYAILGLIGGFTGSWINLPYYYKVREYNDFEARDLWSYDLNLSQDEVDMLALHLWEVGAHTYTYYFFTQNYAFHMLTALEAAAPRLHLIEHVPFLYVIPADSMKALLFEKDLVKNVSFRPSTRKVFLERASLLDQTSFNEFKKYIKTETLPVNLSNLSPSEQGLYLDAAIDLLNLRYPKIDIENDKILQTKKNELLSRRAQVNFISPEVIIPTSSQEPPDQSHGSSRIALGYEEKSNIKAGFINYRFALHDLQDPKFGMPKNSQLEFFNFNFKILPNELKFEEANLFKVFNLSPVNFFENKAAWGFEVGVQNKPNYCPAENRDCLLDGFLAKYGRSLQLFNERLIGWALVTVNGRYGATLPDSKYYLAPGYEIGLLSWFSSNVSVSGTFSREYPNESRKYDQNYLVEARYSYKTFSGIGLRVKNDQYGVVGYYYY